MKLKLRKKKLTESLDIEFVKQFIDGDLIKDKEDYLHGFCQEWALLNYKDGDEFFVITDYDYDIDSNVMTHCGLYRNRKYIDVSGTYTDIDDVLYEFDYSDEMTVDILNLTEFIDYLRDMNII